LSEDPVAIALREHKMEITSRIKRTTNTATTREGQLSNNSADPRI